MTKERKKRLAQVRRRLKEDERVNSEDKEMLLEFDKELRKQGKGSVHHAKLLQSLHMFAKHFDNHPENRTHNIALEELLNSPDAVDGFLDWLDERTCERGGVEKHLADNTKIGYRESLRAFGKIMTAGEDRPAHIGTIKQTVSDSESDPTPHPSTILFWGDHIVPMLDESEVHIRDKALIAIAWDSGARPWEIADLLYKDVIDNGNHLKLVIRDGKTINRNIRLIPALPWYKKWEMKLNELTDGDSIPPETPLWTHQNDPVEYQSDLSDVTKKASDKANISRPTNLRRFRKSRASILAASKEVTIDDLRDRFGWSPMSPTPAYYKARFDATSDQHIADFDGADVSFEEERADASPVECPTCGEFTPRHRSTCIWCTTEYIVENVSENSTSILDKQETELTRERARLLSAVEDGDVDIETIEKVQGFANILKKDPDISETAREFLKAVDD